MNDVARLDLTETGDWQPLHLGRRHRDVLTASDAVGLRPTPGGGWQVRAGSLVGAAVLGSANAPRVDLRIQPKTPVDRLLFLMGYATSPKAWRDEHLDLPENADVPNAVAGALARLVDRSLRQGVLQDYSTIVEAGPTLRGRVRYTEQVVRRFGVVLPVEHSYDDFSPDIPENRILNAALDQASRIPGLNPLTRGRLTRLRHRFEGVTRLTPGADLPAWRQTRLNTRYQPALRLAEVLLRHSSFDLGRGSVPAVGFLVSMPRVFEDFVCVALSEALGGATQQDNRWALDTSRLISLRPDLVWPRTGPPRLVVDAKYKAEKPSGFPNADVYQVLAYCTALGLPTGHLVYASGNEEPRTYSIPRAGVTVVAHCLDLQVAPWALLGQISALASGFTGREQVQP